jgi:hypothetical protein
VCLPLVILTNCNPTKGLIKSIDPLFFTSNENLSPAICSNCPLHVSAQISNKNFRSNLCKTYFLISTLPSQIGIVTSLKANCGAGTVAHDCNSSCLGGAGMRIISLQLAWVNLVRSCLKNKIKTKRAGSIAWVVELLCSKQKSLDSIPIL